MKAEIELELAGGVPVLLFRDSTPRTRILPSAWPLIQPGSTVVAEVVDPLRRARSSAALSPLTSQALDPSADPAGPASVIPPFLDELAHAQLGETLRFDRPCLGASASLTSRDSRVDFQRIVQSLACDSPKTLSHVFVHADGHLSASAPPSPAQTLSPSFSPTSSRRSSVVAETALRTLSPTTSSSALSTYRSARSRDATPERSPRLLDELSPPHSPASAIIRSQQDAQVRRQPSQHQIGFHDDESEEEVEPAPAPVETPAFRGLNHLCWPGKVNGIENSVDGIRRTASPALSSAAQGGVKRHSRNGSIGDPSLLPGEPCRSPSSSQF